MTVALKHENAFAGQTAATIIKTDGRGLFWPKVGSCWQKSKRPQRTDPKQTKVPLNYWLRQLGDVHRNPSRLIAREQLDGDPQMPSFAVLRQKISLMESDSVGARHLAANLALQLEPV